MKRKHLTWLYEWYDSIPNNKVLTEEKLSELERLITALFLMTKEDLSRLQEKDKKKEVKA